MNTNLKKYINARRPIIWINSSDYKEVDDLVREAIQDIENKSIFEYRALGAVDFETKANSENGLKLYDMLDTLYSEGIKKQVFLLIKNADEEVNEPKTLAYIKKIAEIRYVNPDYNFTILIVSESGLFLRKLKNILQFLMYL